MVKSKSCKYNRWSVPQNLSVDTHLKIRLQSLLCGIISIHDKSKKIVCVVMSSWVLLSLTPTLERVCQLRSRRRKCWSCRHRRPCPTASYRRAGDRARDSTAPSRHYPSGNRPGQRGLKGIPSFWFSRWQLVKWGSKATNIWNIDKSWLYQ